MKKENVFGLIMYLVIFALAVVYGLTVLQPHFANSSMNEVWQYAIYIVLSIVAGVIISALLFELGHTVGAKVGGYNIVSFNVLYFSIYLDNDKRKVGFRKFDGLTGETIIVPNYQKNANPNPFPYLLYGPIFNLAWFVGTIILFITFNNGSAFDSDMAYAFLTVGLISIVLFVYDFAPFKTDTLTDGYRFASLLKFKNRKAFNDALVAAYTANHGELPSESIDVKAEEKINLDTTEGKIAQLYTLIDEKNFEEAKKMVDDLLANESLLTGRQNLEIIEQQLYLKVMTEPLDEMREFYNEMVSLSLKREISSDNSIIAIRTYLLLEGLLDKSQSECLLVLKKIAKAYKNTPQNRKHAELVLFNEALDKVCEAHPKWEIGVYRLFE